MRLVVLASASFLAALPACSALDRLQMDQSHRGPTTRPGGVEPGRLTGITEAHNAVRERTPASPALPPLQWSEELAAVAQRYAGRLSDDCALVHSTGTGFGENLASFGGQRATPTQVVELWADELDCYEFGPFLDGDSCSSPCDACGHYTQIVWRDTQLVGCGVADCGPDSEVWVCNYDPPGNYVSERPY